MSPVLSSGPTPDTNKANYHNALEMIADGLHGAKDGLLDVRVDVSWGDGDAASLAGETWKPHLKPRKAEDMFTEAPRPINDAISMLSTHPPRSNPGPLCAIARGTAQATRLPAERRRARSAAMAFGLDSLKRKDTSIPGMLWFRQHTKKVMHV